MIHIGSFIFSFLLLVVLSIDDSATLRSMHSCNKDLKHPCSSLLKL